MNDAEFGAPEAEYVDGRVCVNCYTTMFYDAFTSPTVPGQVYSPAGVLEVRISGTCEHCFDEITEFLDYDE